MAEVASAYVALIPSFKGAERQIANELGSATGAASSSPALVAGSAKAGKQAGKGMAAGIRGAVGGVGGQLVGAMGLGALVSGVSGYVQTGVAAAGELEQSVGAIQSVFKGSSGQMLQWSKDAATAVGLTQNEYNTLATVLGSQLKNGGTAIEEIGGKTNELVGLGADLASMFGGNTADAVGALSSALRGERDPIERYGVSLTQAAIDAKAAELGFEKVGATLSQEANQAATLALIMDQTADSHGNFGREADTAAGKQQRFDAAMGNLSATMGSVLLPVLTALVGALMPIALWFADNQWAVVALAGVLSGVLVLAFVAAAAAAWAFTAPLLANPITWVVVGIVALVAALVLLIANWQGVVAWLKGVWAGIVPWLSGIWRQITSGLQGAWGGMLSFLSGWGNRVRAAITGGLASLAGWLAGLWARISAGVTSAWNRIVSYVTGIPARIRAGFGNVGSMLYNSGRNLVVGFMRGIQAAWRGMVDWVRQGMANLRGLWPFSPAKWGPFSGRGYVTYSGAALTGDFASSIQKGTPKVERAALGVMDAVQVPSTSWQAATQVAPAYSVAAAAPRMPSSLTVVDSDGALVGRMRVEAGRVQTGGVTPLSEGRVAW